MDHESPKELFDNQRGYAAKKRAGRTKTLSADVLRSTKMKENIANYLRCMPLSLK